MVEKKEYYNSELNLRKTDTGWLATTDHGDREVRLTFITFEAALCYEEEGRKFATKVSNIDYKVVTRGDPDVSKKWWEKWDEAIEHQKQMNKKYGLGK